MTEKEEFISLFRSLVDDVDCAIQREFNSTKAEKLALVPYIYRRFNMNQDSRPNRDKCDHFLSIIDRDGQYCIEGFKEIEAAVCAVFSYCFDGAEIKDSKKARRDINKMESFLKDDFQDHIQLFESSFEKYDEAKEKESKKRYAEGEKVATFKFIYHFNQAISLLGFERGTISRLYDVSPSLSREYSPHGGTYKQLCGRSRLLAALAFAEAIGASVKKKYFAHTIEEIESFLTDGQKERESFVLNGDLKRKSLEFHEKYQRPLSENI